MPIMETDPNIPAAQKRGMQIGDATLTFLADSTQLEASIEKILDRMERTIAAARAAWNASKEA